MYTGKQILVVEDNFIVAMDAEDTLRSAGANVIVANDLDDALSYVSDLRFDCAILDYNIGNDNVVPVAKVLMGRKTPFAIVSGADKYQLSKHFGAGDKVFRKPVDYTEVVKAVLVD